MTGAIARPGARAAGGAHPAIACVQGADARLGETPLWNDAEQRLYWIDIERPSLHALDPGSGASESWPQSCTYLGSQAFAADGRHVLARDLDLFLAGRGGTGELLARTPGEIHPRTRLNDGRVDPEGLFRIGTMDNDLHRQIGGLCRVGADGTMRRFYDDVIVSNGIAFAPDGRHMWFTDTRRHLTWKIRLDADGDPVSREVFADYQADGTRPDGACVDVDGCLWQAFFAGGDGQGLRPVEPAISRAGSRTRRFLRGRGARRPHAGRRGVPGLRTRAISGIRAVRLMAGRHAGDHQRALMRPVERRWPFHREPRPSIDLGEDIEMTKTTRRALLMLTAAATMAASGLPAMAQDTPTLRFSAVFSEQDIRAEMMQRFEEAVSDMYDMELYYGGNLFKQGTEIVAVQRGNLEMANVAPQDIANQIPAFSILTSAYLFRDAEHLQAFFDSDVGAEMKTMAEDQLGIHILGPTYFGTRQVGLNLDTEIQTPEDMQGVKLRMPGGDAWQFLGQALGANPTPMAYAEVYTGLQSGVIDGQDNPLPNVENMKFYEVMQQIVMTSHLVGYDLLVVSQDVWEDMSAEEQEAFQAAADEAIAWSTEQHLQREEELTAFMEEQGLTISTPDVEAFREHAQSMYLNSELSESWPEGMIERINAL